MTPVAAQDLKCPTCGGTLKPVPTRADLLQHYWCREERIMWAEDRGTLMPCELAERHVAFYDDLVALEKV